MNKIFHFLKFQEFINELGKLCFPLGKNVIENFVHTTEFLTLGIALQILLLLYLYMLIMQISTQNR